MVRWVAGWLVLGAIVLGVARLTVVPRVESWLLIGATRDESIVVARYSVSNTGLFADQLTTRLALLRADAAPIAHRSIAGPAQVDGAGVHGALDRIEREGDAWNWHIAGDSLVGNGVISGSAAGCPTAPGELLGFLHLPDGLGAEGEAIPLRGTAVAVRTGARGNAIGSALYAFDQNGVLGLDPLGECPGFLTLDGIAAAGAPPWIPPVPDERFTLNFAGHVLEVRVGKHEIEETPLTTTLLPERWLAAAVGYHLPSSRVVRARVTIDGRRPWSAVLMLGAH
ncbi:hypothetical protein LBMAG42_50430 [Deltaproteobacteria bacterium]|nr:hypothetical protein LBMAG42_50430 [Deltaproteobacteria bacterium]